MIVLLLFFALKNILVLLAKLNSGELRCPATALIIFSFFYHKSIFCDVCTLFAKVPMIGHVALMDKQDYVLVMIHVGLFIFESHHEKTCLCHMLTTKTQIGLGIHCLDSILPLLARAEISRPELVLSAEQASLSLNWSQTPKTGFLVMWLNDRLSHCGITIAVHKQSR